MGSFVACASYRGEFFEARLQAVRQAEGQHDSLHRWCAHGRRRGMEAAVWRSPLCSSPRRRPMTCRSIFSKGRECARSQRTPAHIFISAWTIFGEGAHIKSGLDGSGKLGSAGCRLSRLERRANRKQRIRQGWDGSPEQRVPRGDPPRSCHQEYDRLAEVIRISCPTCRFTILTLPLLCRRDANAGAIPHSSLHCRPTCVIFGRGSDCSLVSLADIFSPNQPSPLSGMVLQSDRWKPAVLLNTASM